MAKTTPKVQHNQLYLNVTGLPLCQVGSSDWFVWLETATVFRYYPRQQAVIAHSHTRPMFPVSLRKEKRRLGYLWYAYRRAHGVLHKRYVGKSAALTTQRLDEVATWLDALW